MQLQALCTVWLCNLQIEKGMGSKARKACSTPSSHSRGGIDVDVMEQKDWARALRYLRIANRRKGPMLREA